MIKFVSSLRTSLFIITLLFSNMVWSVDIIKMTNGESSMDKRTMHKNEVIKRALEITIPSYGAYEFKFIETQMNHHRALPSTIKGTNNNVYVAPANDEWNKKTLPIKIPIRRGLLNYRLLLIHKADLSKFAKVNTLDDLKKLTAGLRNGWVTTDIFHKSGLKTIETRNFEGLFLSLDNHRFNYLPRAIYEIFDELHNRKHLLSNVIIEPTLAIHLPMPTYIYVSPTAPRIAERLEAGLRKMLKKGELKLLLNKYYADDIKRANLKARKIIKINNPYYDEKALLNDKSLWYKF